MRKTHGNIISIPTPKNWEVGDVLTKLSQLKIVALFDDQVVLKDTINDRVQGVYFVKDLVNEGWQVK
jgi:hypothetical protein